MKIAERTEAEYLRPGTCARSVERSRAWAYALIASGDLRAVKVAGALRVPRDEWRRWLSENVKPVEPEAGA